MHDRAPGLDISVPNVARIWDYQLGGKDNFEVDRHAAETLNELCENVGAPDGRRVASESRAFLQRAVRCLARAGVDQYLDIGSGLPTRGNVHEIAQEANPLARTVYVDYDPSVLAHGNALLADHNPSTAATVVIKGDVRKPETILQDKVLRGLLDLDRPVAVLLVAMLHLIPDTAAAAAIVATFRDALSPGSYLVLTHTTSEHRPEAAVALAAEFERLKVTTPLVPRRVDQIRRFFDGFELLEPGLVSPPQWRPDTPVAPDDDSRWMYAGVGQTARAVRR
ncbi:SAM-dependent methyltransferase [Paractinoplanes rishiriensis]|uniref:S-adenosyl methyltransferase n=1 Tax=Paractinoplanes rishiriensis TaxID=1050105 RepID=A0A919K9D6_9ACTN|nr:SAM-dependent methyltransferase [Actinoplanes rishiriensis]GIF01113.1 hypothetical protein Ari01nite_85770 [Actinoplanes rishiriensis]